MPFSSFFSRRSPDPLPLPPQAIELKEDFRSALFNLALLLTDDMRPLEAAPFLNQLVKHHPDHVKGLILLGDIYINNIKDLDAAEKVWRGAFVCICGGAASRGSRRRGHSVVMMFGLLKELDLSK